MRTFTFNPQTGHLCDERGPILEMRGLGGHIYDTGALIAKLLTWHAEACSDMNAPFYGPIMDTREGR